MKAAVCGRSVLTALAGESQKVLAPRSVAIGGYLRQASLHFDTGGMCTIAAASFPCACLQSVTAASCDFTQAATVLEVSHCRLQGQLCPPQWTPDPAHSAVALSHCALALLTSVFCAPAATLSTLSLPRFLTVTLALLQSLGHHSAGPNPRILSIRLSLLSLPHSSFLVMSIHPFIRSLIHSLFPSFPHSFARPLLQTSKGRPPSC